MRAGLFVAMLTLGSPALADDSAYRNELIVIDGISAGTVGGGAALGAWVFSRSDFQVPLMITGFGLTGYALGAPVVHVVHGRLGRGAASFGMRVLIPAIVGATLVTAAGVDEDDNDYGAYFGGGMALGAAIAIALDWWLLVPSKPRKEWRVAPILARAGNGGVLGVGGLW